MNDLNSVTPCERWQSVPEYLWRDWRWQMSHRLTTREDFMAVFPELQSSEGPLAMYKGGFRAAVTPFIASLMAFQGPDEPLGKQLIPAAAEQKLCGTLSLDPLGEERDSPVPGLIHRYTNRVLLLISDKCFVYCRYCNRRRRADGEEKDASNKHVIGWLDYLGHHPEVNEVILSGGDPLIWRDARLENLLGKIRDIPSVSVIRICSRAPVVLPFRVTERLCRILAKHHPVYLNIHVNHPSELTWEMKQACDQLASAGIPLGSQTVLLRGINDEVQVLETLMSRLLTFRVKPYSLYHCDPVQSTEHFRTTITAGKSLVQRLIAGVSGLAVPHYVVDAPEGLGKIPLLPDFIESKEDGYIVLRNLENYTVKYPDGCETLSHSTREKSPNQVGKEKV